MPSRPLLQPRTRALPGVPHDRPSQGPSRCLCSRLPPSRRTATPSFLKIQCALVCTSCKTQRARVALNLGKTKRARVAMKGKTTRARRTEVKIHTNPARSRTDVLSHAESMQHPFAGSALGTGPACTVTQRAVRCRSAATPLAAERGFGIPGPGRPGRGARIGEVGINTSGAVF
jgi:hypothetical protein